MPSFQPPELSVGGPRRPNGVGQSGKDTRGVHPQLAHSGYVFGSPQGLERLEGDRRRGDPRSHLAAVVSLGVNDDAQVSDRSNGGDRVTISKSDPSIRVDRQVHRFSLLSLSP
eukprot:14808754-Alexandrium_andersonii.AAC.1